MKAESGSKCDPTASEASMLAAFSYFQYTYIHRTKMYLLKNTRVGLHNFTNSTAVIVYRLGFRHLGLTVKIKDICLLYIVSPIFIHKESRPVTVRQHK